MGGLAAQLARRVIAGSRRPAGAHRVAFRVDDGPWQPPADLPAVDDEYGGRVGLLVVP